MKKTLILCIALASVLIACSSNKGESEEYQAETLEMEQIEGDLNETSTDLEEETEDMNQDVDSLLDGI